VQGANEHAMCDSARRQLVPIARPPTTYVELSMKNPGSHSVHVGSVWLVHERRSQLGISVHAVQAVSDVVLHGCVWKVPSGHVCGKRKARLSAVLTHHR
jgi:hypothetical protein